MLDASRYRVNSRVVTISGLAFSVCCVQSLTHSMCTHILAQGHLSTLNFLLRRLKTIWTQCSTRTWHADVRTRSRIGVTLFSLVSWNSLPPEGVAYFQYLPPKPPAPTPPSPTEAERLQMEWELARKKEGFAKKVEAAKGRLGKAREKVAEEEGNLARAERELEEATEAHRAFREEEARREKARKEEAQRAKEPRCMELDESEVEGEQDGEEEEEEVALEGRKKRKVVRRTRPSLTWISWVWCSSTKRKFSLWTQRSCRSVSICSKCQHVGQASLRSRRKLPSQPSGACLVKWCRWNGSVQSTSRNAWHDGSSSGFVAYLHPQNLVNGPFIARGRHQCRLHGRLRFHLETPFVWSS